MQPQMITIDANEANVKIQASRLLRQVARPEEKYVMLRIRRGKFGNEVGVRATITADADESMYRVTKKLLESPELDAISKWDGKLDRFLQHRALPFGSDAIHAIGLAGIAEVVEYIENVYIPGRQRLVNAFLDAYELRVAQSLEKLREIGEQQQYPSREVVASRFYVDYYVFKLDVPGNLGEVNSAIWRRELEKASRRVAEQSDRLVAMSRDLIKEVVDDTLGKLTRFSNREQKTIKQNGIDSFKEFLATFKYRNFMDDSELAQQVTMLEDLMRGIDAETLRDRRTTRQRVQDGLRQASEAIGQMISTEKQGRVMSMEGELV